MPTCQDEEETLCLLSAADHQDQDSPGPRKPAPSPKSVSVSSDGIKHKTVKHSPGCDSPLARAPPWRGSCSNVIEVTEDNILVSLDKTVKAASRDDLTSTPTSLLRGSTSGGSAVDLATRNAERTFFDVIGGASGGGTTVLTAAVHSCTQAASISAPGASKKKYKKISPQSSQENYESSIKVVSEILGDLEDDVSSATDTDKLNPTASKSGARTSLVVDVHIPPGLSSEQQPLPVGNESVVDVEDDIGGNTTTKPAPPSGKLCKHEVNRFQTGRCYSDSTHHSNHKWKPTVPAQESTQPLDSSNESSSILNIDKIETIGGGGASTAGGAPTVAPSAGATFASHLTSGLGSVVGAAGFMQQMPGRAIRSFMADSWASRQRRSTESEADAEAFRRDLDGGDDFRLDEVATLSDNNRVSMSTVSTTSGGSTLMQGVVGGGGGGGRSNKVSSVDSGQAQLFTKPSYTGQHQPPPPPAQSSFKPKSPYTFFQLDSDDDDVLDDFDFNVVDDFKDGTGNGTNNADTDDEGLDFRFSTGGGSGGGMMNGNNVILDDTDGMDDVIVRKSSAGVYHQMMMASSSSRAMMDPGERETCLSQSSSTMSMPVCRICQLPSMEPNNMLISPCRCLGSIRYVHNNCLLKWLEVSSKRRTGPPSCELCQYQYLRHKKFVISHWRFPECSLKDKILHFFFVISVCLMIACAAVTIICFRQDRRGPYTHRIGAGMGRAIVGGNGSLNAREFHESVNGFVYPELSAAELITMSCGVLFFLAFFLAMYVEVKARNTVYQLICKFFHLNNDWSIEEYDRKRDLISSKKQKKKEEKLKKQQQQRSRNQNSSSSSSSSATNTPGASIDPGPALQHLA